MRILHVVPTYIPAWRYGGPIQSVHGLCKALAARGHAVEVATTNVDGDGDSAVPLDTPVELDGVRVHYFPSTLLRRLYFSPPMRRFLEDAIPRCDIVHTHSVFLWPTNTAASLARAHRTPYVLSPRGMLVRELIGRRNSLLKKGWIRLFEQRNVAEAAAVHVTSALEAADLLRLGLAPQRTLEIPNGVDQPSPSTPFDEASQPLPPRFVLFLGRISWKKGLDRLVDAMAAVPGMALVIAGPDDEQLRPTLERKAAALGIADRVSFLGFVHGDAKQRLLSRAAIVALPSHSENFGNSVLEAMAHGVPVVVTPEVGLAQFIQETGSGLVARGDTPDFARALRVLAEDAELRGRMSRCAAAAALRYSWAAIAERMEAEYAAILARRV